MAGEKRKERFPSSQRENSYFEQKAGRLRLKKSEITNPKEVLEDHSLWKKVITNKCEESFWKTKEVIIVYGASVRIRTLCKVSVTEQTRKLGMDKNIFLEELEGT